MHESALDLTEVLWVGPENRGVYVGSPSIYKTTGKCYTSHDFFGRTTIDATVQVFVDETGNCAGEGAAWRYAGNVSGMYWANIFTLPNDDDDDGSLYLMGVSSGDAAKDRSIVLSRSGDGGATWSSPATLLAANATMQTNYHCAPTPTLLSSRDGRLYRAFETGSEALVLRTRLPLDVTHDLLSAAAWEATNTVSLDSSMIPASWGPPGAGRKTWGWQEGNAIELPDGGVANMLRIDGQTAATHNKAALLVVDASFSLRFEAMVDFPATTSKFVVRLEPRTTTAPQHHRYFSLTTDVTPVAVASGTVYARNHLVLATSVGGLANWSVCATLLVDDTGFLSAADSARFTGFHYVDWIFDGADIVYAIRTGYRGANSYHNANRLTTKRLSDYAGTCARGLSWQDRYTRVGGGWCRPTAGYRNSEPWGGDERECAQWCDASDGCAGFAANGSACALYPRVPTASSGADGFSCWRRA